MNLNPFHEAAINHMADQLAYLERLIKRPITDEEKDNIHEFFEELDSKVQDSFRDKFGDLL